jgi:hypothetical protein
MHQPSTATISKKNTSSGKNGQNNELTIKSPPGVEPLLECGFNSVQIVVAITISIAITIGMRIAIVDIVITLFYKYYHLGIKYSTRVPTLSMIPFWYPGTRVSSTVCRNYYPVHVPMVPVMEGGAWVVVLSGNQVHRTEILRGNLK